MSRRSQIDLGCPFVCCAKVRLGSRQFRLASIVREYTPQRVQSELQGYELAFPIFLGPVLFEPSNGPVHAFKRRSGRSCAGTCKL